MKGMCKEDKLKLGYDLDLENSYVSYIPQTQKQYFYYALDYALKNNTNSVKVNRIKFYFDFDKIQVAIGMNVNSANIYKMKKN